MRGFFHSPHKCIGGRVNQLRCKQRNNPSDKHSSDGYTLVELMITVALAAVLGGLALPTFSTQTKKAKFIDAETAISAAFKRTGSSREEKSLTTSSLCSDLGLDNSATPEWEYSCEISPDEIQIQATGTGRDSTITPETTTGRWTLTVKTGKITRGNRSL